MRARAFRRPGPGQRRAGYAVLGLLACVAVWLLAQQPQFNPAVVVAMRGPLIPQRAPMAAAAFQGATASLLPEPAGFSPLGLSESYDPETLSDKIDGKAELYLPAGFKEMSCRLYGVEGAGGAHVEAFLYDMSSPQGAFAVFSGQRRPGSTPLDLTPNAYATTNAVFFTKGAFYAELVADRVADPALAAALTAYARALLAGLPAGGGEGADASGAETGETALFPQEGLARDSVRLSAADAFGLEGFSNVYTADYSLKSGEATAFAARRPTPDEAAADARRYAEFLAANGYKELSAQGQGLPQGARLYSLDTSFEALMLAGNVLAGVHDASSLEAAKELCAGLGKNLAGKQ